MRWKLSDPNKSLLLDLNFRTALLESVDWDETQSASLLQYLNESLVNITSFPEEVLNHIRDAYGESAHSLIKKMFKDVYIENGLYVKAEDDYEH